MTCTSVHLHDSFFPLALATYRQSQSTCLWMMASSLRPASRLVARPLTASSAIIRQAERSPFLRAATTTALFHTSSPRNALPSGPPPSTYRLPKPKRFDEGENVMDKASNYFLLTEMLRGMY